MLQNSFQIHLARGIKMVSSIPDVHSNWHSKSDSGTKDAFLELPGACSSSCLQARNFSNFIRVR